MVAMMNNNDERDYEEEQANRRLMEEGVEDHAQELLAQMRENGITFDMEAAEHVVATAKVEEPKRHWYITFGYDHRDEVTGQRLYHRYCIVEDTYLGARDQIMQRFGTGWAAIYPCADDLPREERVVDGRELPEHKWRGAGVKRHGLTYFDHRLAKPSIADQLEPVKEWDGEGMSVFPPPRPLTDDERLELDREKAGFYEDFTETHGFTPDWRELDE